jgi:hypothetical protein
MSTLVKVAGSNVTVSGTPGKLTVTEATWLGAEGVTITDKDEFLSFCGAIYSEAASAWPGIQLMDIMLKL